MEKNTHRVFDVTDIAMEHFIDYTQQMDTLGKYLIQETDLKKGKIITYLPSDIDEKILKTFTYDIDAPYTEPHNWMHNIINENLKSKPNSLIILLDAQWRLEDYQKWMQEPDYYTPKNPDDNPLVEKIEKERLLSYNNEVHFYLNHSDKDNIELIKWMLSEVYIIRLLLGVMTIYPFDIDLTLKENRILKIDFLKGVAQSIDKIVIGAYDGYSFLLLGKNGLNQIRYVNVQLKSRNNSNPNPAIIIEDVDTSRI